MSDWSGVITYLLYEFHGAVKHSPEVTYFILANVSFYRAAIANAGNDWCDEVAVK